VPTEVVTFDAGQTLVELDLDFLASRLGERGLAISAAQLDAAAPAAWRSFEQAGRWQTFMETLLAGAGARDPGLLADWLWSEQATKNLFRKPIADMIELARELAASGVVVAVLSNSEGRLAELLAEVGIADIFAAVIDSGRVGVAKPDRRIFELTLERVGGDPARAVHIGDSWSADVEGALASGWRAVWFRGHAGRELPARELPARVQVARDAAEVRAALRALAGARG